MRGMRTSSSTRSGCWDSIISSALTPSAACATSTSIVERNRRMISRFAALSSTTSTTGFKASPPEPPGPAPILNRPQREPATRNAGRQAPNRRLRDGDAYVLDRRLPHSGGGDGQAQVPVGGPEVAARLQQLGVGRVRAGLPLSGLPHLEPLEGGRELGIDRRLIALGRGDPAEPDVGLAHVCGLARALRDLQRGGRV